MRMNTHSSMHMSNYRSIHSPLHDHTYVDPHVYALDLYTQRRSAQALADVHMHVHGSMDIGMYAALPARRGWNHMSRSTAASLKPVRHNYIGHAYIT